MEIVSTLAQYGNDLVGNIDHAYLGFTSLSELTTEDNQTTVQTLETQNLKKLASIMESKSKMSQSAVKKTLSKMVFVQVDYNPETLRISANKGLQRTADNKYEILNLDVPASAELTADIIFDQMSVWSSFTTDKLNLSLSNAASSLVSYVTTSTKSVQSCVEGMAAAIMDKATRPVIFVWGNTFFSGNLIGVSAQYTMFNTSGDPVRAKVRITIRDQIPYGGGSGYWDRANTDFCKLATSIGGDGDTSSSMSSWATAISSLINV